MMLFVRADREGGFPLHMYACRNMLPYFYAANHNNYARYGLLHYRQMSQLHGPVLDKFINGEHVMRHVTGHWNSMWSDMMIERTYIHQAKGTLRQGSLIGISTDQQQVQKTSATYNSFAETKNNQNKLLESKAQVAGKHREEQSHRLLLDKGDHEKLEKALKSYLHPLLPDTHAVQERPVNIFTGEIFKDDVNVQVARFC